ncbi:hypothetical protein CAPTEDRAFT_220127 [Capitella teleta]|uniref:Uncharacterized protein n=1 Tax=Capitella teleta TaxID=283909 RepID=R7UJA6_CAPTE|nr:hypothetical protein CAPTEDRAFT_220127 [Capitella teleta]|eukprot:ELU06629.1 hypothetical protein CAPTEDRAFT_220127 [Capitella teleta]
MDDDQDFEDFGGFEAAEPVAPAEAQPVAVGNAEAAPSPWALFAAAAPPYQSSQPDVIQPPQPAAQVPNVVAEVGNGGAAGGSNAGAEQNMAYFDANFDDFCLDQPRPSAGRSLSEQVLEPDFNSLRAGRNPPPPDGVLDLDLAMGTPRSPASTGSMDFDLMTSSQPQPRPAAYSEGLPAPRPRSPQLPRTPPVEHSLPEAAPLDGAVGGANPSDGDAEVLRLQEELQTLSTSEQSLQEELDQTKELLAAEKQKYNSVQSRHQAELRQLREAGNEALALVVEEYKNLCSVAVLEQQQKSEEHFKEVLKQEAEKWEQVNRELSEKHKEEINAQKDVLEKRIEEALKEQNEHYKIMLENSLDKECQKNQEQLRMAREEEEERSRVFLENALEEERTRAKKQLEEAKEEMQKFLMEERGRSAEAASEAAIQGRQRAEESMASVLQEERRQATAMNQRVQEEAKVEMQAYIAQRQRDDESVRQRALSSMDILLNATRQQLQMLMERDEGVEEEDKT